MGNSIRKYLSSDQICKLEEIRKLKGKSFKRTTNNRYWLKPEEISVLFGDAALNLSPEKSINDNKKPEPTKNNPRPFDVSAYDDHGKVMSFREWADFYNLMFPSDSTFKMVTHTGKPYYNVQFPKQFTGAITKDIAEDLIVKALSKMDITKVDYKKIKIKNKQALHVYLSDTHFGAKTETSVYENDYNEEVVYNRIDKVLTNIIKLRSEKSAFDTLFIGHLGDALDGFNGYTTRGGHKLPQNLSNKESFDLFIRVYKDFIDNLIGNNVANNYVLYFVANSNHGGDFDWMAMRTIQEYCNIKYPKVEVIIQDEFVGKYKYGKHTFLMTHGKDDKHMKSGMPKILDKKTELWIKDYINYHDIDGFVSLIKGDLHQDSIDFANTFRYRNVLSLYGASAWIHHNFSWNKAGVSCEIIDKNSEDIYEFRWFV